MQFITGSFEYENISANDIITKYLKQNSVNVNLIFAAMDECNEYSFIAVYIKDRKLYFADGGYDIGITVYSEETSISELKEKLFDNTTFTHDYEMDCYKSFVQAIRYIENSKLIS